VLGCCLALSRALWALVIAAGTALEFWGVADHAKHHHQQDQHELTFTEIVKSLLPRWMIWAGLGWLIFHFGIQT